MYLPSPVSSRKVRRKLGGRKAITRLRAVIPLHRQHASLGPCMFAVLSANSSFEHDEILFVSRHLKPCAWQIICQKVRMSLVCPNHLRIVLIRLLIMLLDGSLPSGTSPGLLLRFSAASSAAAPVALPSSLLLASSSSSGASSTTICLLRSSVGTCMARDCACVSCQDAAWAGAWPESKRPPVPSSSQALGAAGGPCSASSLLLEPGRSLCCIACQSEAGGTISLVAARLGSLCLRSISCTVHESHWPTCTNRRPVTATRSVGCRG